MTHNLSHQFIEIFLLCNALLLLFVVLLQPVFFKRAQAVEREKLLKEIKRLKAELEEATARAEKYEEDFQRELTRVSILLNRVM